MAFRGISLHKPPPTRDLRSNNGNGGPTSPRSAEAALFSQIFENCPPSSQSPLSWFVLDLMQLTKDPMAQNLNDIFSFDKNLGYMAHLLQSVPIIGRDEEIMDYVDSLVAPNEDGGESKTSGEFESLKLLMEFVATLGFSMTSSSQMESFIAKVLELFDKTEYSFVVGLLFALASYDRAIMGFLSRLVGFGKKSKQLVESLFKYGVAAVTSVFRKIKRARTQQAAEPLIAQFDSLISQVRIVIRVASAEGPEGVRKSGIIEPIRYNAEKISNCLADILSGEDFSLSVTTSFFSLITTLVDAMSPISQETQFVEKIISDAHMVNLLDALSIVGLVTKPPIVAEKFGNIATNLWNWQILMMFKDREGNPIATPDQVPKPRSRQRDQQVDANPFEKSKKTSQKPEKGGAVAPTAAEWQTRITQHAFKNGSGHLRWGPITPFMLCFIDLFRALATSRSKAWTDMLAQGHLIGHFAGLALRISNDVISNSLVSALYKILDKGLPELMDQESSQYLPEVILCNLTGQSSENKSTAAVQQARMIRLLALLKIEIKSPSKPVQVILQKVLSAVPDVAKVIPSWQEQGKTDGVSAAKMHEPDYETSGRPSSKQASGIVSGAPPPSSAASSASTEIVNKLIAAIKANLAKAASMPKGAEQEAILAECHVAMQQVQSFQQGKSEQPISSQSNVVLSKPESFQQPAIQAGAGSQQQQAQGSSSHSAIQELTQDIQFRTSRYQQTMATVSAHSQQLEREIASFSEAERQANQALILIRRQEVEVILRQLQEQEMIIKERERALMLAQQQSQPQQPEQRSALFVGLQPSVLQQGIKLQPDAPAAVPSQALGGAAQLQQQGATPQMHTTFANGGFQPNGAISALPTRNILQNASQSPYASLSQPNYSLAQMNAGNVQQGASQATYASLSQLMNNGSQFMAGNSQQGASQATYVPISQLSNAAAQLNAGNMQPGSPQTAYPPISQMISSPQQAQNSFSGNPSLVLGSSNMMTPSLMAPAGMQGSLGQGMNQQGQLGQQQPRLM